MNFALYSYIGAAIAYGCFAILLLFSWRASLQGKLLTCVISISAIWAILAASISNENIDQVLVYRGFEVMRNLAWYVFLLKLFDTAIEQGSSYQKFLSWALPLSMAFAVLVLLSDVFIPASLSAIAVVGHVILALIGLAILEQLFRNTAAQFRWAMKYIFIGAGGIFAFDFYLYSDALLFRGIDQELWSARGIVHLVALPLLAVSAVRSKNWSLNIFVSRDIILNTSTFFAGGIYLLLMAGAGYYLKEFGGSWGRIGQVSFFSLAIVLLITVLSSSHLRARIKVFIAKHFYKNKYDYRNEWLRLTEQLGDHAHDKGHYKVAIEALAKIVDARAGLLWLLDEHANYKNVAVWHAKKIDAVESVNGSLIQFFENTGFIINLNEIDLRLEEYQGLVLPEWALEINRPWLVVPLHGFTTLTGFIVLANPLLNRSINWEDRDLLITAAKQISSYLTILTTSNALAEARQFEVFTRLSAYMVHDLKNIASELEMVSRNSKHHMNNPEFIVDAFDTVDNAAAEIKRLLDQLRNKQVQLGNKGIIDLAVLVRDVVNNKKTLYPKPHIKPSSETCFVVAEKSRLTNVLTHLLDNAQQATQDNGSIDVALSTKNTMHIVEIKDNGHGMDDNFIRDRLFKPFDTTKGNAGMGIGMYESREFVQQLGGDIRVQSEIGKGSTVSLYIPVSVESALLSEAI